MRGVVFSIVVLTLAGCAYTGEVTKVTEYHYEVMATADPSQGGVAKAQTLALAEAYKHCASMKTELFVTKVSDEKDWGFSTVTFRCLAEDEQGYIRNP
jgi:hypothetical protein